MKDTSILTNSVGQLQISQVRSESQKNVHLSLFSLSLPNNYLTKEIQGWKGFLLFTVLGGVV